MAKKINEKMKEIKKDLLFAEASTLFETVGYENMKISDLAKNAGVSQSRRNEKFGLLKTS